MVIEPDDAPGCAGLERIRIGEDVCERLDVTPAKFRVIVTRRPKYVYKGRDGKPAFAIDSFYDVLSGKIPASKYANKIVIIGPTATGVGVQFPTPGYAALTPAESEALIAAIRGPAEKAWIDMLTDLLLAGKDPRRILDTIQIAAARVILSAGLPDNFSMPHHGYEYTNTMGWFFDTFDHPHRVKLLYVACSFIHQSSGWVRDTPEQWLWLHRRWPREVYE